MFTAESIPTEVWEKIITSACTDGGITGRALALTSKFFHAQFLSVRFLSVALNSLQRTEALTSALRSQAKTRRPINVVHLCLTFVNEPVRRSSGYLKKYYNEWAPEEKKKHEEQRKNEKDAWDGRFIVAMSELFALVGPTLRTLCIVEDPSVRFPPFPCEALPKLEELTLKGHVPTLLPVKKVKYFPWDTPLPASLDLSFKLPALKRLHSIPSHDHSSEKVLECLATHAPASLTHLRISNISCLDETIATDLSKALNIGWGDAAPSASTKLLNVRCVIVEGCAPEFLVECGTDRALWQDICEDLEALFLECERGKGMRVLLLQRPSSSTPRWEDKLYNDWLDRIDGGSGCWVRSDAREMERQSRE
ncbi:hypothetical protein C8Q76DRAFT_366057 [Earliella scabrosa]|nr:hypothetical protein C8Q76DRAFT_366057 [Earliella scabrosa]